MTKCTTITCDGCGMTHKDASHARLWGHLRTVLEWNKGPKVNGDVTHWCPRPACQGALSKLRREGIMNAIAQKISARQGRKGGAQ